MAFDPVKYLLEKESKQNAAPKSNGFDPVAYLSSRGGNIINTDVPTVAGQAPNPAPLEQTFSAVDKLKAAYEVPATILSGAALSVPSMLSALVTKEGPMALAQRNMYQPTSPASQEVLQNIGSAFEATKLPPVIPNIGTIPSYSQILKGSPTQAKNIAAPVQAAGSRLAQALREPRETATMSGVGAALVPETSNRTQLAEQLRVPIKLTKGQATRDLDQQQFEIETAKTYSADVGKPLIERKLEQNQKILSNFDAFLEPIGSKVAGPDNLYAVGKVVDQALVKKAKQAKSEINDAYNLAREKGELSEAIDVSSIKNYLNNLEAEAVNAPIITSAKMKLDNLAPDNKMTINDLEEIRKMVGRLSGSTPTNMEFGKEINKMIDATTEGRGGEYYKNARKLRAEYAKEFENIGVIDKLLSTKRDTGDRAVAFEKVFDHSILNGSLDDVKAIGRTLKQAGPEGEQAWRELVGQTVEYMREGITKNISRDANGNPIVSAKQFDTLVKNLDRSGKLDYIFGKNGAQEIRNLRDTAITVYDVPQGVNTSNTSSAIMREFNKIINRLPLIGPASEVLGEAVEKRKISKRVKESIDYSPEKMADVLRKGN